MTNNRIIEIVASESSPEKEAEYDAWYTDVHIPMLFGYKGMKKVSRYRLKSETEGAARFLSIYEFESQEAVDKFQQSPELAEAMKDFENMKDKVDFKLKWIASYEMTKTLER